MSSTAMPKATLAIITVAGSRAIPPKAITANAARMGKILGRMDISISLRERSPARIQRKMAKKAATMLYNWGADQGGLRVDQLVYRSGHRALYILRQSREQGIGLAGNHPEARGIHHIDHDGQAHVVAGVVHITAQFSGARGVEFAYQSNRLFGGFGQRVETRVEFVVPLAKFLDEIQGRQNLTTPGTAFNSAHSDSI